MPKIFKPFEIRQLSRFFDFPQTINRFREPRINQLINQQGFQNVGEFQGYWREQIKNQQIIERKQKKVERQRERRQEQRERKIRQSAEEEEQNRKIKDFRIKIAKKRIATQVRKIKEKEQNRKIKDFRIKIAKKRIAKQVRKIKENNSKRKFFVRFNLNINVKYKNSDKLYNKLRPVDREMDYNEYIKYKRDPEAYEQNIVDEFYEFAWVYESPYGWVKVLDVKTSVQEYKPDINLSAIKMKDACSLMFAGEEHEWDTKQGRCVFDFLIWRYGNIKGFKKVCNYYNLDDIFKNFELVNHDIIQNTKYFIQTDNPLTDGVDTLQIMKFCTKFNVPMYALDEDNKHFNVFIPEKTKRNKDAPSLVYKVLNNHFYPVVDRNEVNKYAQAINNSINSSSIVFSNIKDDEKYDITNEDKFINAEILEDVDSPDMILYNAIKEYKTLPNCIKDLHMTDGIINQFSIVDKDTKQKKNYIINQNIENLYMISDVMGLPFTGQSIHTILSNILTDLNITIPVSNPNPHVYDTLTIKGVKDRTHYGCVNGYYDEIILKELKNGTAQCADIAKCHTACLYEPDDDWVILDFNDNWIEWTTETYDVETLRNGLYQIETEDFTLFHGNNVYSRTMLQYAKANNINFTIKKYIVASHAVSKEFFKPILDKIREYFKDAGSEGKNVMKLMINILSGYLGKQFNTQCVGRMNSDINQAWSWIQKNAIERGDKPFIRAIVDEEGNKELYGKTYYLYGKIVKNLMSETNIPMYIQMKDYSNIRLHKMIKAMGGTLAFRKVDCAITIGGDFTETKEEWGGWRIAEAPMKMGNPTIRPIVEFDCDKEWTNYDICDSSDWKKVFELVKEKDGLMVIGRAGTGKSYVSLNIAEALENDGYVIKKTAFTNKACLILKGTTLHKFMKLDKDSKIPINTLKNMRDNLKIQYVIVDEVSMVPEELWKRLIEVKRFTGAKFILVGDNRQCPPVDDTDTTEDYFNHSAVKYLTKYNRIEFTVMHRYNKELWDMLEDVDNLDLSVFGQILKERSICYTNHTRKWVNNYWMNKKKPIDEKDLIYIPYLTAQIQEEPFIKPDDNLLQIVKKEKSKTGDEYPQNAYIYEGLPIISRLTVNNGDVMVSNEYFTVVSFDENEIICSSKRLDDNNEPYEHSVTVVINEFHKSFLVNYCATVHKSQGETITDDFTILDWECMETKLRYTALSRAKNPEQVNFVHLLKYNQTYIDADWYKKGLKERKREINRLYKNKTARIIKTPY